MLWPGAGAIRIKDAPYQFFFLVRICITSHRVRLESMMGWVAGHEGGKKIGDIVFTPAKRPLVRKCDKDMGGKFLVITVSDDL